MCACMCLCGCVRGEEVRNNERKKGKRRNSCGEDEMEEEDDEVWYNYCWIGRGVSMSSENFNLPFLILKVRCPVIS